MVNTYEFFYFLIYFVLNQTDYRQCDEESKLYICAENGTMRRLFTWALGADGIKFQPGNYSILYLIILKLCSILHCFYNCFYNCLY